MSISAIIPCYNEEAFIGGAIESLIHQSFPDLQIIVVDDGSTDETEKRVREFGEAVTYVRQKNQGVSTARNLGVSNANSEFFLFLDADDRILPGALELLVSRMNARGESCGLVTGRIFYGEEIPEQKAVSGTDLEETQFSAQDFVLRNRICSAVLVRRKAFENVGGYDAEMTHSEDRDLWARIAVKWEVIELNAKCFYFTNRPTSASKNARKMKAGGRTFLAKAEESPDFQHVSSLVWIQARSVLDLQASGVYAEQGNFGRALWELALSFLHCPVLPACAVPNSPSLVRLRRLVVLLIRAISSRSE
ncbi:MAG: glycosyltransferase family A protein [Verrucomicrobiales bacterium]|nr:glycosyltransferase family A protein [Verrucomicrobiales bacterium]